MKKILLIFSFALLSSAVWAQDRIVTGKVTAAEDGSTLPGVTVSLKGTTTGTVTDAEGSYKITVPPGAGTIVFSFIGLKTEEIPVGDRTTVDISLSQDVSQLSEVVVTGAGAATDRHKLGISVESITAEKLPATPSASIDQALIGKIAGAQISSVSGNPGDPVNIVLRGINSVQGGTKPLIMVDGVQVAATDMNSLDLSNVERIEVVQGAASASIYGAQGSNGVIQIFTKKGKQGKMAINFSTSYSSNSFLNTGNVHKANLHPYLTDANNNLVDDTPEHNILGYTDVGGVTGLSYQYGGPARYAIQNIQNVADKPYNANLKYYDQFKQVFKTGYTTNNTLSFSGAGDKSDYNVSLANNHTLSPVMKNGYVDRTNISINTGMELAKGLKFRSITQVVYTRNTMVPGLGGAGGVYFGKGQSLGNVGAVYGFLNTSPFFSLTRKDADGNYPLYQEANFVSVNSANPYYYQQYASGMDNKIDVIQNFNLNYLINKFVEIDAKYGINYRTEDSRNTYLNQSGNSNSVFYDPNYIGPYAPDNTGEIDSYHYTSTFQNLFTNAYIRTDFKDDFHINLPIQTSTQVGYDMRKRDYKEYDTYGQGLPIVPPINIQQTATQHVITDYNEPFLTFGYLVNQKIDYGDFGGVTGGFRSDYSSAFGGGSKPFTFPHIDGHILPSTFWKNATFANTLSYFKLRAAYGQAGIQPNAFDRYPTLVAGNLGSQLTYSNPTTLQNPNLKVEVSTEKEIGTDFTFNLNESGSWFKSIGGSVVYWQRKSSDVIYPVSTPPSSGAPLDLNNLIGMHSNGTTFSINLPIYTSSAFKWDLTTNFNHQRSYIDKINGPDVILTSSAGSTALVLSPGAQIGQIYGYKALTSLDYKNQEGKAYIDPADQSQYEIVNGRVVNKSNYQIQFTNETYPLTNPNPKFNMSFISNLSYKDFIHLSFQFDWIHGSHLYNQTKEWMYRDGISGDFTKQVTIDPTHTGAYTAYWSSAYYNLWGSTSGAGNNATKDFFIEDASFLRLRNVSLALDFGKILKVQSLKRVQLVLSGRNLWTHTKYTGFDPEVSSGAVNSSFDRGVDHSTLPNTKSYQVGLNIGL